MRLLGSIQDAPADIRELFRGAAVQALLRDRDSGRVLRELCLEWTLAEVKSTCPIRREHCPYCGGHDSIAIHDHLKALLRGETFWCGYCHSTFTEDTPKKLEREYFDKSS